MPGIRVLIAGGRAFDDDAVVHAELELLNAGIGEVSEVVADDTHAGDAAMRWAAAAGIAHRRARPDDLCNPTLVAIAFPDGVVLTLRRAGFAVRMIPESG